MDRIRAIDTFVTVVEANSFSEAAKRLNVSGSSVTRILKDLESDLGVLLLKRTTRQFALTDAGKLFYENGRYILKKLKEAENSVKSTHETPVGELKISAPAMFGALYVTPIIAEFLLMYPQLSIDAVYTDQVEDIVDKDIDVAVRIGHLGDSSLIARKITSVSWITCASPAYFEKNGVPETINELFNHELVELVVNHKYYNWKFKDDQVIFPQSRLTVNSVLSAKSAALSHAGIIQVLSYQLSKELSSGALVEILREERPAPIPVHLIHSEGRNASAKVRLFSDFLAQKIRKNNDLSV